MISTYAELQAAVAKWLNRSDLTDTIPDFITLGESFLNRELRSRLMVKEAPLTIVSGSRNVALPADYISPEELWIENEVGRRSLRYLAPGQMIVDTGAGWADGWTITAGNIQLDRPAVADLALILRYTAGFSLSEEADTNWLLQQHPDAYLFAALTEAAPFLRDTEALAIWTARRDTAVDQVNAKDARSSSLATLTTIQAPMPSRRGGFYDGVERGPVIPASATPQPFDFASYYDNLPEA